MPGTTSRLVVAPRLMHPYILPRSSSFNGSDGESHLVSKNVSVGEESE